MWKRIFVFLPLLSSVVALGRDKPENWLRIDSPHFAVVTNSNEKQARRVADQFERMRAVFHVLFPKLQIDPGAPIIVLAIKDEKNFRLLEPAEYLAKGQLKLGGLFLRGADKNYVLMRLDAEGEHPYAVVYHEYTHLLLSKADWIPLWMNEGLAEFYQNTDIQEKEVALGQPNVENLELLRQNRLLPLSTLFTVDTKSPYYHEENKGSIFYAESWALVYYLYRKDFRDRTQTLTDYGQLLAQNVDAVSAAGRAFGDLKQLQSILENYVRRGDYQYLKMASTTDVDESTFHTRALSPTEADATRADFLAYNGRLKDAQSLLDHALQEDPGNVAAHESMGFLEFRQGHLDEARKWYAQAVKLDSRSYLAHYYFAAIAMNGTVAPSDEPQVESSLRAAIKLNSAFAPAYDRLAVFLGMRHRALDEAHTLAIQAVQLEPGNLNYRLDTANVLLQMERGKDAVAVIHAAMHLAKSPEEVAMAQNFLQHTEDYAGAQAQMEEQNRRYEEQIKEAAQVKTAVAEETTGSTGEPGVASNTALNKERTPRGPHHFMVGVLRDVHCDPPSMDLSVAASGKTLKLHSDNYYKIQFTALHFMPKGELQPCTTIEGMSAKVEFVQSADRAATAQVVGIELHK